MKVDFTGRYRDTIKIIDQPNVRKTTVDEHAEFGRLLSDLIPKPIQHTENTNKITQELQYDLNSDIGNESPMARMNLPLPEQFTPPIPRIESPIPVDEGVNPMEGGVKSPTVISAKRVAQDRYIKADNSPPVEFAEIIRRAGERHGVSPDLGLAVASVESSFNPNAISQDIYKTKGLFQLKDKTGKELLTRLGDDSERYDPFNPKQNAELGIYYLKYLFDLFGSGGQVGEDLTTVKAANSSSLEKLALAGFNAGEGRVAGAQARTEREGGDPSLYEDVEPYLPEITQDYVAKVTVTKARFERSSR